MTMAEQLIQIYDCKHGIRSAINEKGVYLSEEDPFYTYPDKIRQIEGLGGNAGTAVFVNPKIRQEI